MTRPTEAAERGTELLAVIGLLILFRRRRWMGQKS